MPNEENKVPEEGKPNLGACAESGASAGGGGDLHEPPEHATRPTPALEPGPAQSADGRSEPVSDPPVSHSDDQSSSEAFSEPAAPASSADEMQVYSESFDEPAVAVEEPPAPAPVEEARVIVEPAAVTPQVSTGGGGGMPPSDSGGGGDGDDDEDGMVKMSFLEHLEELRKRIIRALLAVAVAFFVCFAFVHKLMTFVMKPVIPVLHQLGLPEKLVYTKPTDSFTVQVNLALVISLFLAAPFVLYQVWAFISPGLYRREKKYAVPFVFFCSALFIAGGAFGYLIAFPYALKFLLTFGGQNMQPMIKADEYIDQFWTVEIGLALIFELPVLMMFLGLVRIVNARFLLKNIRYAILLIFIAAAIITPSPDITNMMIFASPMILLYFLGIFLVWMVQRKRQSRDEWNRS